MDDYSDLAAGLSRQGADAFSAIRASAGHLRTARSRSFLMEVFGHLKDADLHPFREVILDGALRVAESNWAMVLPYFQSVGMLPREEEAIARWAALARDLAGKDIDVAIAYLDLTPKALEKLGAENVASWGEKALAALSSEPGRDRMWQAARSYLIESAEWQCAYSLIRWERFLGQAGRIAKVSPEAADSFILLGNRVCLLLDDKETEQWVDAGIAGCKSNEELISYFSGTSLKALEKRDDIAAGVSLKSQAGILSMICEAFLGRPVRIRSNTVLMGQPGFTGNAATDGRTVFLPETAPTFALLKLMALHQVELMGGGAVVARDGRISFDPVELHLEADRKLLGQLPGLLVEMKKLAEGLSPTYPCKLDRTLHVPLPWWGDFLPGLIRETDSTISRLTEKAEDAYADLPPDVVEALLSAMMAEGSRETGDLWKMFREMLDEMEFTSPDAEALEESVKTFLYREWDARLCDYRLDWCLIRQRFAPADPNGFTGEVRSRLHGLINLIRRQFMRLKPENFRKFRAQPAGDALDIDALVQAVADMRSGSPLSENVYIRRDKRSRDVAVLFLLDLSRSTEEMVNGRRVIDIQKEAMVLMAEALESLRDPFAVYGFSSEGRFRVDLFQVKDFTEPYDETVQYRLGNLEPLGLTRLGAVVRHGIFRLEAAAASVKVLIVLTDGRPYDLEYGNLDYAIADSRKSLQEARQKKIHPFMITCDPKGADYLERIAPHTQSIVVPRVELLPTVLPAIYKRLTL